MPPKKKESPRKTYAKPRGRTSGKKFLSTKHDTSDEEASVDGDISDIDMVSNESIRSDKTKSKKSPASSRGRKRVRPDDSDSEVEVLVPPATPKKSRSVSGVSLQSQRKNTKAEVLVPMLKLSRKVDSETLSEAVTIEDSDDDVEISSTRSDNKRSATKEVEDDDDDISKVISSTTTPKSAMKSKTKASGDKRVAIHETKDGSSKTSTLKAQGKKKTVVSPMQSDDNLSKSSDMEDDMSESEKAELQAAIAASIAACHQQVAVEQEKQKGRDIFGSLVESVESYDAVYYGELPGEAVPTSDPSPDECELYDLISKDPLLRKSYVGLPKLSQRTLKSWSDAVGWGNPFFSAIQNTKLYPHVPVSRVKFIKSIVVSVGCSRAVNPSRIDPKFLSVIAKEGSVPRITITMLLQPQGPALFYSVITVGESHLHVPHSSNQDGKYTKFITGKLFLGENERMISTMLMAMKMEEVKAQIKEDWLSFTCRPLTDSATDKFQQEMASPSKSRGVFSPSTVRAGASASTSNILASVGSDSTLCVLDGREKTFDIDKDIFQLGRKLPRFSSEIPMGSIALVGYVASMWGTDNLALSFNWVVVLETPIKNAKLTL